MQFGFPFIDVLTIPTDAGPGDARIVIDGTTGLIEIYDENDVRIGVFGPFTALTAGLQIGATTGGFVRITATAGGVGTISYLPGPATDGSGNTFVQGNFQAGYTPSGEQPTLIIGSPSITGLDDARITLIGETGVGSIPRINFDSASGDPIEVSINDKVAGSGILRQQVETTNDGPFTASGATDFVQNNVPFIQDHWYSFEVHSGYEQLSNGRFEVHAKVNGAQVGRIDDLDTQLTGTINGMIDSSVWWKAPATAVTDDVTIEVAEFVNGSTLTLVANATSPRTFMICHHGKSLN